MLLAELEKRLQRFLGLGLSSGSFAAQFNSRVIVNAVWWRGIHLIAIVALCLRLVLAFTSDHINQPDEIFQYLEQGHRITFGYGYIPWEYRFGIRSWVIPGFISAWLSMFRSLHVDHPSIYIPFIKTLFCIFSVSLVYSAYVIGRNLASETAGRLAAIFACVWWELIYFAHKPTPEVLATYCLIGALACVVRQGKPWSIVSGLLCGLALALRFQYAPAILIVGLYACLIWKTRDILKSASAFLLVIGTAGFVDYVTWGSFFASYYNNYLFNKVNNVSTLFGTKPAYYYAVAIAVTSAGIFCITGLLSLARLRTTWLLLACVGSIVVSHSLLPHKEYRFVLAVIPLLLILTAIVASGRVSIYVERSKSGISCLMVALVVTVISIVGLLGRLPRETIYEKPLYARQEKLTAYNFLNKDQDLVAVLNLFSHWWDTGGYYYLHRQVPIFSDDLASALIHDRALTSVVSHVVCPATMKDIPGFQTVLRMRDLEIRKQINPPAQYLSLGIDTSNVFQPGIDDKFEPSVKIRPTF
jgi:phosphatidylinositol glycan class B